MVLNLYFALGIVGISSSTPFSWEGYLMATAMGNIVVGDGEVIV